MTALVARAGDTVTIRASDLAHEDTGPVVSGATGTLKLFDAANMQVGATINVTLNDGDDWYARLTAPATPARYEAELLLIAGGAQRTWRIPLVVED